MEIKRIIKIGFVSTCLFGFSAFAENFESNKDSFEKINRPIFTINRVIDTVIFKPISEIYQMVLPNPIRKGINNVFTNAASITTIINDVLQLKINYAVVDTWRLAFNTTAGIGGVFDVATPIGVPKRQNDFGLTLARYGIKTPYFVIPVLGPSTVTDALGLFVDYEIFSYYPFINPKELKWGVVTLDLIRIRTNLLASDKLIEEALDPYIFTRNAYLQRRAYLLKQIINQPANSNEVEENTDNTQANH